MLAFYKWVTKHKTLAMWLFSAIEIFIYASLLYSIHCPMWAIYLVALVLMIINYMFAYSAQQLLLKKPLETLSRSGDPDPLFFITEELLTFKSSETNRELLLINHCVALRERGELQRVHDILTGINIDKHAGTPPYIKAVYYNNLADILDLLGDSAQADIWYAKMMQIYTDMPENRFKRALKNTVLLSSAEHCLRQGECNQALQLLRSVEHDGLQRSISVALLCARASLQMSERESARQHLQYIIANGNRLYAVTIAQELLNNL